MFINFFVNIYVQQLTNMFKKLCFLSMDNKFWSCNAPPIALGCSYIMFWGYPNVTFEHLGALGKVFQKCNFSMNLTDHMVFLLVFS
jgi:hypothetical protein